MRYLMPVLIVVVPAIAYAVWYRFAQRKAELEAAGALPRWQDAPWTWIVVATLAMLAASLVLLALEPDADPRGNYVPAKVEDGIIVPGHVED